MPDNISVSIRIVGDTKHQFTIYDQPMSWFDVHGTISHLYLAAGADYYICRAQVPELRLGCCYVAGNPAQLGHTFIDCYSGHARAILTMNYAITALVAVARRCGANFTLRP